MHNALNFAMIYYYYYYYFKNIKHSSLFCFLQIKAYSKTKLVSSSFDQTMKLWDVEDATLMCILKGKLMNFLIYNLS